MMWNEYIIESNRYDSYIIAAERILQKYVILEFIFPAGHGNDWCSRDHYFFDGFICRRMKR